ncbi:DUF2510 domain-containing protein [Naumannella halotolerans]|uniref:Uncharacterized protein DUF2510 n=1 Tax=Naumannella halotolerans TaxID=993414 RepID=A0A4R7IYR7_9ACTN|nr:DUF2510 domain-containing protein [Naumannella halotolerans]TDT29107.1 uncharacterized protein DUF2510 [Naumannella halotolerans]
MPDQRQPPPEDAPPSVGGSGGPAAGTAVASAPPPTDQPAPVVVSEPGWYHDPRGLVGAYRWWDGQAWTDWLSNSEESGPPGEAAHSVRPNPLLGRRTRTAIGITAALLVGIGCVLAALTWRGVQEIRATPPAALAPAEPGEPQIEAPLITVDYSAVSVRGLWGAEVPATPFVAYDRTDPRPIAYEGVFEAAAIGNLPADEAPDWTAQYYIGLVDPAVPGDTSEELALGLRETLGAKLADLSAADPSLSEPVLSPGVRSGSVMAEFDARAELERAERLEGDYIFSYRVQAEVWPDGTRTAWVSVIGVPADGPPPVSLPEVEAALAESLATTV